MDELRRLANAVLQPGFTGLEPPDWLRRALADGLGGVLLWDRNIDTPAQLSALTEALRAEHPDVLIAIDEEGGDVTRLEARTGSSWPAHAALGAADDVELTRAVAGAIGRDLAAAGINLNYAPVADTNVNPDNPVIGARSFGADYARVAAHTAAFVAGHQAEDVAACAKHFPGHGDTAVDSHRGLPVVDADADALSRGPLLPFRAAIDAGVQAVMSAHIVLPAIDSAPATLSRTVLTGILREELGFAGLVVTDAIEMAAIKRTYGLEEGAIRAIAAGADTVCIGGWRDAETVVARLRDALVAAVRTGRLGEERLREAADRSRRVAAWAAASGRGAATGDATSDGSAVAWAAPSGGGADTGDATSDGSAGTGDATSDGSAGAGVATSDRGAGTGDRSIGRAAARRAIRVVGTVSPLTAPPHVIELSPTVNAQIGPDTHWGLATALIRLLPGTTGQRLTAAPDDLSTPDGRPLVIAVRDAHRHPWIAATLGRLLDQRPDATVVELGLPHGDTPPCATYLATYGAAAVSSEAAAAVLLQGM